MNKYKVVMCEDGDVYRSLDGNLSCTDGPALIYFNGDMEWWVSGKLHREDGPAIEWFGESSEWSEWLNHYGEDSPVTITITSDGEEFWYFKGEALTKEEHAERMSDG